MKFEEAFNYAFEKAQKQSEKAEEQFGVTPSTAKILAFMWNMLAKAQGVFDDIAHIDRSNNIISVPLVKKEKIDKVEKADEVKVEKDDKKADKSEEVERKKSGRPKKVEKNGDPVNDQETAQ